MDRGDLRLAQTGQLIALMEETAEIMPLGAQPPAGLAGEIFRVPVYATY